MRSRRKQFTGKTKQQKNNENGPTPLNFRLLVAIFFSAGFFVSLVALMCLYHAFLASAQVISPLALDRNSRKYDSNGTLRNPWMPSTSRSYSYLSSFAWMHRMGYLSRTGKNYRRRHSHVFRVHRISEVREIIDAHNNDSDTMFSPNSLERTHANVLRVNVEDMAQRMNVSALPRVTVVVNTWRREECLLQVIKHWRKCAVVSSIVLVSSDPFTELRWAKHRELAVILKGNDSFVKVHSSALANDRLTDRFRFDDSLMTEALFSIDDDIYYTCDLLAKTVVLWHLLGRDIAVGLEPRLLFFSNVQKNNVPKLRRLESAYSFGGPLSVSAKHKYNGVWLTQGGIMHRKYYDAFHSQKMDAIRRIVDGNVTAEDIAMSLMYSEMHGGSPPLTVLCEAASLRATKCTSNHVSERMHNDSQWKRVNIALDTLAHLGFNDSVHSLKYSNAFVSFV